MNMAIQIYSMWNRARAEEASRVLNRIHLLNDIVPCLQISAGSHMAAYSPIDRETTKLVNYYKRFFMDLVHTQEAVLICTVPLGYAIAMLRMNNQYLLEKVTPKPYIDLDLLINTSSHLCGLNHEEKRDMENLDEAVASRYVSYYEDLCRRARKGQTLLFTQAIKVPDEKPENEETSSNPIEETSEES